MMVSNSIANVCSAKCSFVKVCKIEKRISFKAVSNPVLGGDLKCYDLREDNKRGLH